MEAKLMQNGIEAVFFDNPTLRGAIGWHHFAYNADIDNALELMAEDGQWNAHLAAEDTIQVVSANGADTTQTCTVYGIDTNGKRVKDTITLNGATAVDSSFRFRYVENAFLSAECAGEITVRRKTGPATILQITAGQMQSYIVHHFNGIKKSYLTYFLAQADDNTTDSVIFELRWYPDDAQISGLTVGYSVIARLTAAVIGGIVSQPMAFCPPQPIELPAGGYIAVYAIGAAANQTGNAIIQGFDI